MKRRTCKNNIMKITIIFSKKSRYEGFSLRLKIWIKFTYCTHEEFYRWLDSNENRLKNIKMDYDIGYSDKVIYFSR